MIKRIKFYNDFILLVTLCLIILINLVCWIFLYTFDNNISYIFLAIFFFIGHFIGLLYFYFIRGSKKDLFIKDNEVYIDSKKLFELSQLVKIQKISIFKYTLFFEKEDNKYNYDVFLTNKTYQFLKNKNNL